MKFKISLLLSALLFLFVNVFAQTAVSGRVTGPNGEALSGASVIVKGTTIGTTTDASGNFTISAPQGSRFLTISYTGMPDREVEIRGTTPLTVSLTAGGNNLDEVVVVGYGTQRRANVTSAISSVKSAEIATVSNSRIENVLQGRTPGVNILPQSGSPGAGSFIRIRGIGSNGNSSPLMIVDGVITGGIDNIDPSEVLSVELLKDAASAAIYGAAAANGVLLITTKAGRRNSSDIAYNGQYARQSVGKLPTMMNASQYQQYLAEAKTNGAPTAMDLANLNGEGTNWFDVLFEEAPQMRHSINFSGGGEKSTYFISGSYFDQDGIIGKDKSNFKRYTFRVNTDNRIRPWLNIGNRFSYANIQRRGISENSEFGSVVGSALALDPFTPVVFSNTLSTRAQNALAAGRILVKDPNGFYYGVSDYIFGEYANPLARIAVTNNDLMQHKAEGNIFADIMPFAGFKFTSRFGIDGAFQRQHGWTPRFWFSTESLNTEAGGSDVQNNWFNWQWENFASYERRFGSHNFNFLLGTAAIRSNSNYIAGSYSGLFREDALFSYADGTPDLQDRIGSNSWSTSSLSYFGRVSYDFDNKYLFSATLRRDGNSLFADGNKWGTFPAVSAGWLISNEDFFKTSLANTFNYLKLRASWGINGNISNVGIGAWQALIGSVTPGVPDANGNFIVGAAPTSLNNPELRWEQSEQIDIGADMAFFNDRLSFTVDYYVKTTKDLLTPGGPSVPAFVGNTIRTINSGNIQNKGWEFDLGYRNQAKSASGLSYQINVNLSTLSNKVTEISTFTNELGGAGVGTGWNASVFKVGLPVWSFRGYQTSGIFQNQAQIDDYITKNGITGYTPMPGDPIVVDVNNDKRISEADHTFIGSPHPDLLYGTRLQLAFKGFDFIFFGQGSQGNDVLMGFNRTDRPTANRPAFFFNNRWTGEGSTNTWFAANTSNPFAYNSDLMVFDGSYYRIRQLQLGYTLPRSFTGRAGLTSARIYVSLDDFFTFTSYPGVDPQGGSFGGNSIGIDRGAYPLSRKALVGLSLNF